MAAASLWEEVAVVVSLEAVVEHHEAVQVAEEPSRRND